MSIFSTSYENAQNVIVTIGQATKRKELISIYLNNKDIIDRDIEARNRFYSALRKMPDPDQQTETRSSF